MARSNRSCRPWYLLLPFRFSSKRLSRPKSFNSRLSYQLLERRDVASETLSFLLGGLAMTAGGNANAPAQLQSEQLRNSTQDIRILGDTGISRAGDALHALFAARANEMQSVGQSTRSVEDDGLDPFVKQVGTTYQPFTMTGGDWTDSGASYGNHAPETPVNQGGGGVVGPSAAPSPNGHGDARGDVQASVPAGMDRSAEANASSAGPQSKDAQPTTANAAKGSASRSPSATGQTSRSQLPISRDLPNELPMNFMAASLVYPSYVIDVNKGAVLSEVVENHDFSEWDADLRAQVIGATVTAYSWDFTDAEHVDELTITGDDTYRVQFTWDSFTGGAQTDTIALTTEFYGGLEAQTQYFVFQVCATDSKAWMEPPTELASWPDVMTPDMLQVGSSVVTGTNYAVDLLDGSISTFVELPTYNPGVAPLRFVYNSMAAEAKPIFLARYELDPNSSVPSSIDFELFVDTSSTDYAIVETEMTNPGNFLQLPLALNDPLPTGRYDWEFQIDSASTISSGKFNLINDSASPFGSGWWLDGLDRLYFDGDDVMLAMAGNRSLFFDEDSGDYITPAGDFSVLEYDTGVYTRTLPNGTLQRFDSNGYLIEVEDTTGNLTSYTYDGGVLTSIEDPYELLTELTYDSGVVTITDPAGRHAYFDVDTGVLDSLELPGGDTWNYSYEDGRVITILDPAGIQSEFELVDGAVSINDATEIVYPLQFGLPTPELKVLMDNIGWDHYPMLTAASQSTYFDGRGKHWEQRYDWAGFGQSMQSTDPLGNVAVQYRDSNGQGWLDSVLLQSEMDFSPVWVNKPGRRNTPCQTPRVDSTVLNPRSPH